MLLFLTEIGWVTSPKQELNMKVKICRQHTAVSCTLNIPIGHIILQKNILCICQEPGIVLGLLHYLGCSQKHPFEASATVSVLFVQAHAAGKHTKWSSESSSRHEMPVLSTKPTFPSLENTILNAIYFETANIYLWSWKVLNSEIINRHSFPSIIHRSINEFPYLVIKSREESGTLGRKIWMILKEYSRLNKSRD